MKRIVHLTFDMSIGGAERVIYNLVRGTNRSLYDVSVLCLSVPIGDFGIQLVSQGIAVTGFDRKPGLDLHLVAQIRRFIVGRRVDVLHCHQYTPYIYGLLASILTRTKVLYTEHGRFYPDCRKLKRALANPLLSRLTDEITAISEATRRALIEYENFPPARIKVIYNGVPAVPGERQKESGLASSLDIPEHAFVMGSVARLDSIKNQAMAIRALQHVLRENPKAYLLLVGDGPERESLERLARNLQLSSQVRITGYRNDAERFYRIMDLFLLTSFSEGTAMTLLEAMAAGLPCIVTDVGGNPEIVVAGQTGYVVASDDDAALAEKILLLGRDGELRQRVGIAGRERFLRLFTVEKMVQEYESLYDALAGPRRVQGQSSHGMVHY
jgi:glycosyltransferase involved in cell wall biosynthesis